MSLSEVKNSDAPWNDFDTNEYAKQYEGHIIWEDKCLARATIGGLDAYGITLGSIERGADVCNGGMLRGPMLIAPLIAESGSLDWIDYGKPQVNLARETINRGRTGDLGEWSIHQTDMGEVNSAWAGSAFRACRLGKAVSGNIFELPEDTYGIASTWFGPESLTEDLDEYVDAAQRFFHSVRNGGGIAIIGSMYGSTGYDSAGIALPAVPIHQENVLQIAQDQGLEELQAFTVLASHACRPNDDPYTYESMGVVIGRKA